MGYRHANTRMDWFQNITGFKEFDYTAIQALLRVGGIACSYSGVMLARMFLPNR